MVRAGRSSPFPVPCSRRNGAVPAAPGKAQGLRATAADRQHPLPVAPRCAARASLIGTALMGGASPGLRALPLGAFREGAVPPPHVSRDRAPSWPVAPPGGRRPRGLAAPAWRGAAAAGRIQARPLPRAGRARAARGCGSCRWSTVRGGPCAGAAGDAGVGPRRCRGAGGSRPARREAALRPRAGAGRWLGRDRAALRDTRTGRVGASGVSLALCTLHCLWHRPAAERVGLGGTARGRLVQPPCSSRAIPKQTEKDCIQVVLGYPQ